MRDNKITNFSLKEKPVRNQFTQKGQFALIEKTPEKYLGDARLKANLETYAIIMGISDNRTHLEQLSQKSQGKYHVVETKKLEALK